MLGVAQVGVVARAAEDAEITEVVFILAAQVQGIQFLVFVSSFSPKVMAMNTAVRLYGARRDTSD